MWIDHKRYVFSSLSSRVRGNARETSPSERKYLTLATARALKVQNETKALFQQRDELQNTVKNLGAQKNTLVFQVDGLRKEQERLQGIIALDEFLLEQT
jgi:uncharacterized protein (DUF3084 family)